MTVEWSDVLAARGARIVDDSVADFGDPRRERGAAIEGAVAADLGHLGVLVVAGADRRSFLQGQLTVDVDAVDATHSAASAWCTAKGRVAVLARVLEHEEEIWLVLPRDLVEPTLARLRMFVLRADARLRDAGAESVRIGLAGEAMRAVVAASAGAAPDAADAVAGSGAVRAVRLPGAHPRWMIVAAPDAARGVWDAALAAGEPVGRAAWELLAIAAGEPAVLGATADQFLPQMLNLERLGGVSFTKGCYVGQEVIARAQHLGRVKRRLYRARIEGGEAPPPGAPIYAGGGEDTRAAGTVVTAASHPDGSVRALAVIADDAAGAELRVAHLLGSPMTIEAIRYPGERGAG